MEHSAVMVTSALVRCAQVRPLLPTALGMGTLLHVWGPTAERELVAEVRAERLLPWSPSPAPTCCCSSNLWWEGIYGAAQASPEGHLQSTAHPFITILLLQWRRHMHGGEGARDCLLWV